MQFARSGIVVVSATLGFVLGACAPEDKSSGVTDRGACDVLIACAASLIPGSADDYEAAYGPNGSCWDGGPSAWASCREFCASTLEALNAVAMMSGDSCGTCTTDDECSDFGVGAFCDAGICTLGSNDGVGEEGDGDGDSEGDGDGDGDPVEYDGVSILMVIDNSSSMGAKQANLGSQSTQIVAPLEAAGIPWRLGITTTDNGNPWCQPGVTTPESGKLVLSSCRTRIGDFIFDADSNVQDLACNDICDLNAIEVLDTSTASDSTPRARPWLESNGAGQTNLANGVSLDEALGCVLPQGINGCGFESTLQSARLTVERSASSSEEEYSFVESGRLLVIVFVTDEEDCSYSPNWSEIFEANGGKTFWSDPDAQFPTSAVCWNAGVNCVGDPSAYDSCTAVDKAIDGSVTSDPDAAVLRPIQGLIDQYAIHGPVMAFGIVGVASDGQPFYGDAISDPTFQASFGIGPGCQVANPLDPQNPITAVPPARVWSVLQQLGPDDSQAAFSICNSDYSPALDSIAAAIVAEF